MCPYCEKEHEVRWLCDPAKKFLDAVVERGHRFDMPTVEFDAPVGGVGMFGGGVLVAGLVVKAALVDAAGTVQPVLVFTGADAEGKPLPEWVYAASPRDMRRVMSLVAEMGEMAIRRAREANSR